jgi:hypothetical protein
MAPELMLVSFFWSQQEYDGRQLRVNLAGEKPAPRREY